MSVLILLSVIFISGCTSTDSNSSLNSNITQQQTNTILNNQTIKNTNIATIASKEPSLMVLHVSDFPDGWKLQLEAERAMSDVSTEGISRGWIKGYMAAFTWQSKDNPFQISRIDQFISVYPIDKINPNYIIEHSDENTTYEELSDPKIGESSKMYKVTEGKTTYYRVEFYNKDILMILMVSGSIQDTGLLKQMATKAENKIN